MASKAIAKELANPNSELSQLFKKVVEPPYNKRDTLASGPTALNYVQQADLLMLPNDKGNRYALVVVDIATRLADAEPLKTKDAPAVLEAFKKIYSRNSLRRPGRLEVDSGNEFRGVVTQYFRQPSNLDGSKLRTFIKRGLPGRHSQQGLVESYNKIIGRAIHIRQTAQELLTGEDSTEWVEYLPDIIADINKRLFRGASKEDDKKREKASLNLTLPPPANLQDKIILEEGTHVRVALDRPVSVTGRVLPTGQGKSGFRAGDIRWSREIHTIVTQVIKPGMSIRYVVSGIPNVAYPRYQLQVVDPKKLQAPSGRDFVSSAHKGNYVPVKIHGRKTQKGKRMVLVEWRGYPDKEDWTWEEKSKIKI